MPLPPVILPGHNTASCCQCRATVPGGGRCWQPCLLLDPSACGPAAHPAQGEMGGTHCSSCSGMVPRAQGHHPHPALTKGCWFAAHRPSTGRQPCAASRAAWSRVCRRLSCALLPSPATGQTSLTGQCSHWAQHCRTPLWAHTCTPVPCDSSSSETMVPHPLRWGGGGTGTAWLVCGMLCLLTSSGCDPDIPSCLWGTRLLLAPSSVRCTSPSPS